jgi:DNA-binding NtrC family response regulator
MKHVLIVDDEPTICWAFRKLLSTAGCDVSVASSAEEGWELARRRRPDVILLDVRLPGMDGLTALQRFRDTLGDVPIVVMTAFGSLETAVRAISSGVVEYLPKPFDLDQAAALVQRLLTPVGAPAAGTETAAEAREVPESDLLVGSSPAMQQVFKQIALAAASDVPVLMTGESGVGKELVARAIHRHSRRREAPFLPVSLPALSPSVVESELFGHVRGAFTGAEGDRAGVLELVAGGTVLLDEIGDVPPELQVKLLRAIERKEVQRVGDARLRTVDFRVIAATHRDLPALIAAGRFREDLFYRLSVFQIHIPPLRERRDDVPQLARHFLRQCQQRDRSKTFTPAALEELLARSWRGNVRELRNAVEHAAIVARGREIGPEAFPPALGVPESPRSIEAELRSVTRRWTQSELSASDPQTAVPLHERLLQIVEPELLRETLSAQGGNRAATAERLGVHRATLRQKLRRYGLEASSDETSP